MQESRKREIKMMSFIKRKKKATFSFNILYFLFSSPKCNGSPSLNPRSSGCIIIIKGLWFDRRNLYETYPQV